MARKFVVRIEPQDRSTSYMTPISVTIPDHMELGQYEEHKGLNNAWKIWKPNSYAIAYALGRITEELARYGLSEALGAIDPTEIAAMAERK